MVEPRTVTVPIVIEQDEDGVWCAHAQLRPGVGAHGEGETEDAALEDLREALTGLIEEFGVPRELSIIVAA
jgi:predicted RNase H-like HicB family nuclease